MTTKWYDQAVNRSPRNQRSTVDICQSERILRGPTSAEDEASTIISESSLVILLKPTMKIKGR
ncbi:unnamed protein product [Amaranthus hypochondriacus]